MFAREWRSRGEFRNSPRILNRKEPVPRHDNIRVPFCPHSKLSLRPRLCRHNPLLCLRFYHKCVMSQMPSIIEVPTFHCFAKMLF